VLGPVRTRDGVSIAAASVVLRFDHSSRVSDAAFQEFAEYAVAHDPGDDEVRALVAQGCAAPWVRGRVERLFFSEPVFEPDRREKSSLYASFVAVISSDGVMIGVPFECTDYYFKASLTFSTGADEPAREVRERIAVAFWGMLLDDPWDVSDYSDRMVHGGAGVTYAYGIHDGAVFVREIEDSP
jgi:hypothetical protein